MVPAPALDRAARQQCARVVPAQSEARRRRDPGHVDGGGAVSGGPVPELAVAVVAPALDRAARQQGAGVAVAQSEACLLYTSPSPRDYAASRMPSSA